MSTIEWTDRTWNPIVGCTKISHGCDHCYAVRMANRFSHSHYSGVVDFPDWTGLINKAPNHIVAMPLRVRKPTVFFVNSMSDMFHDNVQDAWLVEFFDIMNRARHHTFQVLTKRPSRAVKKTKELGLRWSPNIWAGTSIESDKYAVPRSREVIKLPAEVKFISCEPLLSALPSLPVGELDWIIAGGESGNEKSIRRAEPDWFRDLRDRCRAKGVPFFFKQWGAYGEDGVRRSKHANGHLLDGEEIFEMPASAYDRLIAPDPRWRRIEPRTMALATLGLAATTPDQRLAASPPKYVVEGTFCDDDDHIVWAMCKGLTTHPNPNRKRLLTAGRAKQREPTYLDLYDLPHQ